MPLDPPALALPLPADEPLRAYRSKRNFSATPEPDGGEDTGTPQTHAKALRFVVQKHWASSLHYDFRLELDGTMKSWAVPKGPSLDVTVKRMAVQVEDHPISYAQFEGTIPAKQYGAGKVIVWDQGTWSAVGDAAQGYREGNLKFELHGHKLQGRWVLVRMKGKGEKQAPWLLIKEKDSFARRAAEFSVVDEQPHSVLALGAAHGPTGPASAAAAPAPHAATAATHTPAARPAKTDFILPPQAVPAVLPAALRPQLATLAAAPPADAEGWIYEIKFDGYRMLARIDGAKIQLFTRNGHDWSAKLAPLQRSLARMKLPPGWYDGEIVLPDAAGIPDFGALQQCFDRGATDEVVFYVFDLPYVEGHDLRAVPLHERRAALHALLSRKPSDSVRLSEVFEAPAHSVLASACKLGLEGVIAKRSDSSYSSSRSSAWLKLKCGQRQEFVVGGYTDPQGERSGFGALLLGVYDAQGALHYAGHVGSGFSDSALQGIRTQLESSARKTSPFEGTAKIEGRPHWVEPVCVAEVSFAEWTRAGRIRHAVFRGLRTDKDAKAVVRETALRVSPDNRAAARSITRSATRSPTSSATHTAKSATTRTQAAAPSLLKRVRVTHPDRIVDASTGTSKIELLRYYAIVGAPMMKHLKGRPVALVRAPDGVEGPLFFQKHAQTDTLPGVRQLDPALYLSHPPMIEVASAQGLLSAAQWNVIEFHTLNTGTASLEHPDRLVFDLDPGAGVPWVQVQEAAQLTRSFLDALGLPAFLKTSGGKGLHVVVPIRKGHSWETAKGFSQAVVQHMAKTIPQRFVAKSGPKNRVGKIFIDYLRNGLGASTVSAWSARARPGLGISVPVAWDELGSLRGGDHWNVKTVHQRLDTGNAPWSGYARAARGLGAAMQALGYEPAE